MLVGTYLRPLAALVIVALASDNAGAQSAAPARAQAPAACAVPHAPPVPAPAPPAPGDDPAAALGEMVKWAGFKVGTAVPGDPGGWVTIEPDLGGGRAKRSAVDEAIRRNPHPTLSDMEDAIAGVRSPMQVVPNSPQIGVFIGGTGSSMFEMGNVERLFNAYKGTRFYYGGIGNPVESGSPTADAAVGHKFEENISLAEKDILAQWKPGTKVHLFGWSRGAAQANELAARLSAKSIPVDFVGMLDPVYSVGLPGQSSQYILGGEPSRNTVLARMAPARNVVVIYAAGETRTMFPATLFAPQDKTALESILSPGTHADVGGALLAGSRIMDANYHVMASRAGSAGVAFAYHGLASDISRQLRSKYGQARAITANKLEKFKAFATNTERWEPPTEATIRETLAIRDAGRLRPAPYAVQKSDGYNWASLLDPVHQPRQNQLPRDLGNVTTTIHDVAFPDDIPAPGRAQKFLDALYHRTAGLRAHAK